MFPLIAIGGTALRSLASATIVKTATKGFSGALRMVSQATTKATMSKATEITAAVANSTFKDKAVKLATQLAGLTALQVGVDWVMSFFVSEEEQSEPTPPQTGQLPFMLEDLRIDTSIQMYEISSLIALLDQLLGQMPLKHTIHSINLLVASAQSNGRFSKTQLATMQLYAFMRMKFNSLSSGESITFLKAYWQNNNANGLSPLSTYPEAAYFCGLASAFGPSALIAATLICIEWGNPTDITYNIATLYREMQQETVYDAAFERLLTSQCNLGDYYNTAVLGVVVSNAATLNNEWGIRTPITTIIRDALNIIERE